MSASKLLYSPVGQSNASAYNDRDRAVSPSRAKISQLSEKLSNLQHQIDEDQAVTILPISVQKRDLRKQAQKPRRACHQTESVG